MTPQLGRIWIILLISGLLEIEISSATSISSTKQSTEDYTIGLKDGNSAASRSLSSTSNVPLKKESDQVDRKQEGTRDIRAEPNSYSRHVPNPYLSDTTQRFNDPFTYPTHEANFAGNQQVRRHKVKNSLLATAPPSYPLYNLQNVGASGYSRQSPDNFAYNTLTYQSPPSYDPNQARSPPSAIHQLQDPNFYTPDPAYAGFFPPPGFSLEPGRTDQENYSPFNVEISEVGDSAYIVPEDVGKYVFTEPPPAPPRNSFGLSINDGQVARNEVRKDNGEYISSFSSSDGTSRSDRGALVPKPNGEDVLVQRGSYAFTSPEGVKVRVEYTADANGYHAQQYINEVPQLFGRS